MMNVYGSPGRCCCGCCGWWPSVDTTYVGQGAALGSRESTTHSFLTTNGHSLERRGLGAVDAQRGGDGGPRGVPPPIQQEQAVAHLPQAKRAQSCGPRVV